MAFEIVPLQMTSLESVRKVAVTRTSAFVQFVPLLTWVSMLSAIGNCNCFEYVTLPFVFDHLASATQRTVSSDELDELDDERFDCPKAIPLNNNQNASINVVRMHKPPQNFKTPLA